MTQGLCLAPVLFAIGVVLAGTVAAQDNSGLDELSRRDELFGWEAVGRIDVENGGFFTGALATSATSSTR